MVEELFTVKQVLALLKISRAKLYSLMEKGTIKPVKLDKRTLFPETELTRFIEELKQKRGA